MSFVMKTTLSLSCLALFSSVAYAENENSEFFRVVGSETVMIPIENQSSYTYMSEKLDSDTLSGFKTISLMRIIPSDALIAQNVNAQKKMAIDGGEKDYSSGIMPFEKSSAVVDLGMNDVPVLDQGKNGTCVTFASTAALDALLEEGDLIDQQCTLSLNKALGNDYWDGASDATQVYAPLKKYGFIKKGNCFGSKYPDKEQVVTLKNYKSQSIKTYAKKINYVHQNGADLQAVKDALNSGYRVIIGTLLANNGEKVSVNGFNMKIDGNVTDGGLWACEQPGSSTNYCKIQNSGHEVVIIGYDDGQRLLKIRNSWSKSMGDNGNYYMTYNFFNAMNVDHTVIK